MRAATITSLAVLGLSAAAIATVGAEGQRTRHHHSSPSSNDMMANGMNSTDPSTMNGPAMNSNPDMPMSGMNGSAGATPSNGM